MSLFRFAEPLYLWTLLIVLLLLCISFILVRKRYQAILSFFGNAFNSSYTNKKKALLAIGLAMLLATFALARPQAGLTRKKVKSLGVETVILVDVSQSMLARDIKPSRLDFIKNEIAYILDSGVISRASLVAFAGSSVALSPLTSDLSAIKVDLESLSVDSVGVQGTNITSALSKADESFFNGGVSESAESSVAKILLLFSDGEDNEPGAVDLARKLAKNNISVFTIAIGTEAGSPIPIVNRYGQQAGYLKNKKNETVVSKLKPDFLKKLAKETKGRFYHFNYGHKGSNQLIEHLKSEEAQKISSSSRVTYTEYFQLLLILSFLILLYTYSKGFLVIFIFCSLSYSNKANAFSVSHYLTFREAQKALKSENYTKANELYSKVLILDPKNHEARLNLALTYDIMKEFKKSEQEYMYLESEGQLSFYAAFNFANSLSAQKKTDKALEYYQKALELKPGSKKVKANIELLLLSQQKENQNNEDKNNKQDENESKDSSSNDGNKSSEGDSKDQENSEKEKSNEAEADKEKQNEGEQESKEANEPSDTDSEGNPSEDSNEKSKENEPEKQGQLSEEDINQILDEINRQEQKIRAKEQGVGKGKGQALEKSW